MIDPVFQNVLHCCRNGNLIMYINTCDCLVANGVDWIPKHHCVMSVDPMTIEACFNKFPNTHVIRNLPTMRWQSIYNIWMKLSTN
mmetsp:Transcript_48663/g.139918  ORF Transcript_48663/g.139918 Transcript_48663/m.139918 type:complete len:85 (-) Transcript_48663:681-935(-)